MKVPLKAPVRTLAALEEALASNRLKQALQDDADPRVRVAAVWALGHVRQGVVQAGSADGALQSVPYHQPPRLVEQSRLVYPPAAFDQGIEGTVVVEIVIDEEGRVAHADVRGSIPALDAAAVSSIRGWRFTPATLAGKPVPTMASVPVTFSIRAQK